MNFFWESLIYSFLWSASTSFVVCCVLRIVLNWSILYVFERAFSLKNLLSILEANKTQCSVCMKFIHRNTISRHMKNVHGDSPRVQCQHCEKICKNLTSYKDHLRRDHCIYQSNWWSNYRRLLAAAAGQDSVLLLWQGIPQGQLEQTCEEYPRTGPNFSVSILPEEF